MRLIPGGNLNTLRVECYGTTEWNETNLWRLPALPSFKLLKALITNRVRYRSITTGKSNHPRGIPSTTNSIAVVLPQRLSILLWYSRGYRIIPAIPITVQHSTLQSPSGSHVLHISSEFVPMAKELYSFHQLKGKHQKVNVVTPGHMYPRLQI